MIITKMFDQYFRWESQNEFIYAYGLIDNTGKIKTNTHNQDKNILLILLIFY